MTKYWNYKKYNKSKGFKLTKKQFHWLFYIAPVLGVTIYFSIIGFFSNCVWPPRWHFIKCFKEQIAPVQQKAFERTADFMPELKI